MKSPIRPGALGYALLIISLPLLSAVFLYLETVTHYEFLLHVAAIPLEILAGAILLERYLGWRERARRARQLVFIKSTLFRAELRSLYLTNFGALAHPRITLDDIKSAGPKEISAWLEQIKDASYRSPEAMESVITEYVAAYPVFDRFLHWAIDNDCERIFHDMIMLMHFIHDVKLFKDAHPDKLFVSTAAEDPELMERIKSVLTAGLTSFLKFCAELQRAEPRVFASLLDDYRYSAAIVPGAADAGATA
jgi:hypothetical protein